MNITKEDKLHDVLIYKNLNDYEEALIQLINTVDKFKPSLEDAKTLIQVDEQLFDCLDSFHKYDRIDSKLRNLDQESNDLDQMTKNELQSLNECYEQLNALPTLEQVQFEMNTMLSLREKINSKDVNSVI